MASNPANARENGSVNAPGPEAPETPLGIEPAGGGIPRILYPAMALQYAVGGAFLPFVTLYFRDRGLSYHQLGWIFLASSAAGSVMPFLWGYMADRHVSLERLISALHLVGAICLVVLARQDQFLGILALFAVVVGSLILPAGALLNACSYHNISRPEEQFGRLRLWGSIGWTLPSVPVFVWLVVADDLDLTFTLYLAAGIELCMAGVARLLPHTPPVSPPSRGSDPARIRGPEGTRRPGGEGARAQSAYVESLRKLVHRQGFARFLVVVFLMHGSFAILFYYSPPLLESIGFERKWIGPLQCLGVVVEVPLFCLLPGAILRLGYGWTLTLGCTAIFLRHLLCAVSHSAWILATSYALAGVCVVFYLIAGSLAINALASREVRATTQTLFSLVGQGLGQMAGHQVAGFLAAESGLDAVFIFATLASALAVVLAATLSGKGFFRNPRPAPRHTG